MRQMVKLAVKLANGQVVENGRFSVRIKRSVADEAQKLVGQSGLSEDQIKQKSNWRLYVELLQINL